MGICSFIEQQFQAVFTDCLIKHQAVAGFVFLERLCLGYTSSKATKKDIYNTAKIAHVVFVVYLCFFTCIKQPAKVGKKNILTMNFN